MKPGFLILGTQKGGTTFLHGWLSRHPAVRMKHKEIHFFDLHYDRGLDWYGSRFPPGEGLAGEASPYYLFHPLAPVRIRRDLPQARLIVLLRDPVARAYSHYQHERRLGYETLSFEEALEREEERLHGEAERIASERDYRSFAHRHFSYRTRGCYLPQLAAYEPFRSEGRLLVLRSEDLFERPRRIYREVTRFLGLAPLGMWRPPRPANVGRYEPLPRKLGERLREFFEPHNRRLYGYLGRDLGWER